jgi:hypothetical protein
MRSPRDFLKPLALGAPDPVREIPFTPSRMIHFFDPSNEKKDDYHTRLKLYQDRKPYHETKP